MDKILRARTARPLCEGRAPAEWNGQYRLLFREIEIKNCWRVVRSCCFLSSGVSCRDLKLGEVLREWIVGTEMRVAPKPASLRGSQPSCGETCGGVYSLVVQEDQSSRETRSLLPWESHPKASSLDPNVYSTLTHDMEKEADFDSQALGVLMWHGNQL